MVFAGAVSLRWASSGTPASQLRVRLSDKLPKKDRSYPLGHVQCVCGPALHLHRHSGYLVAQSAGSSYVGGAALVGRRRNVGERWFWTGALRGRSPCTREGRRPDRPKTSSEEWENTFSRLIQGGKAVAAGQLPLNQGPNGAKNMQMSAEGARHPEASKHREPCRCQASERIIQCLLHPKQQCYNHFLSGQVRPVDRCCKFDFFDCNGGQPIASKQH